VNPNIARVCGLRPGVPLDEKLALAIANPASKWSVRYVKCRGLSAVFVSGMRLESVGAEIEARRWLTDLADRLPEFPHIRAFACRS
jgi:hypothetical protein